MLINDNEYGAPWNDQLYVVTYKLDEDEIVDALVLQGPYHYTDDEIATYARGMFGDFIDIISIKDYHEVYR